MTSTQLRTSVRRERRGAALWLRLARPDVLNCLDQAILDDLTAGLDAAEHESSVRVVVITGEGRAFCAGADLAHVRSLGASTEARPPYSAGNGFLRRVGRVFDRIEAFPKPVVAAVNGFAVGGGMELLLACDFAVAARSARLGDGHAVYGQIPGGGATVRLVRRLGPARAKHLMFTGELYPAEHYLGTDLLLDVVADERLMERVDALAEVVTARSPVGIATMKRLAGAALDAPLQVGLERELDASALYERTDDWREGLVAFAEKRSPRFTGR
jgi:enoyl-CoA hydratase/carnithine racemase